MQFDFNWPSQTVMQPLDTPTEILRFDIVLNEDSWLYADGTGWGLQFNVAGNSGGAQGWTQVSVPGSFSIGQVGTIHVEYAFSQLGWGEGGATDSWFQLYFGANSASQDGVGFFIDNIQVVPEPASLTLLGLGAAAMMIIRRRK